MSWESVIFNIGKLKVLFIMKKAFYTSISCLFIGMIGLAGAEGAWREFYLTIMTGGCLLLTILVAIEFMFNTKKD